MKRSLLVILLSILACSVLYHIEQSVGVSYIIKTGLKLVLFIGLPLLMTQLVDTENSMETLNYKKHNLNECKLGFFLGSLAFGIIMIAFVVLKGYIDFDNILNDLQEKLEISATSFIFIGFYITFINSLLEEYFFRGFLFFTIYNMGYKKTAYLSSSLLFGLYHMAIFKTWFSLPILILAVSCLVLVSTIFNYLNIKSHTIFNSWIVHLMADAAIIIIGIILFFHGIN